MTINGFREGLDRLNSTDRRAFAGQQKTVDISDLASINLQMGDVVEVTRTRILSPNRSWDETDENVELFGDLNLEVHKLPKKSDAVVSESLV